MRNFLLNYLSYGDSNQIIVYIDCNRIKSSIDQESLWNTYTGPLINKSNEAALSAFVLTFLDTPWSIYYISSHSFHYLII